MRISLQSRTAYELPRGNGMPAVGDPEVRGRVKLAMAGFVRGIIILLGLPCPCRQCVTIHPSQRKYCNIEHP